ncbi:MAG TPA: gamma-glutamyl-gamma-aminobutyrate hydrolase family protein [Patescibacteria group bacterium]|jgi:putative glutamine amidotransferase|nr:gamma-glutamyl-gamma-aminobutyrate hydrolase family protein [Patescibacteria group bacterium]
MPRAPLILVSPDIENKGREHGDRSISLSARYSEAVGDAGGLPVALAPTISRAIISQCVARADGVLLTGGDDVQPGLYNGRLPGHVSKTVNVTPDSGERDLRELLLIDEIFRQRKPLLAICRGHQMLNVALGGSLVADIPSQKPKALPHGRNDERDKVVHDVRLTPGSLLAKITGGLRLGVNSTHHQAVGRVAPPLRVTATSGDGLVEGLELKAGGSHWLPFLLSVQFHPERLFDRYPAHRAIFVAFTQVCALNSNN